VAVVTELQARGLEVVILSGDRQSAVEPVASALGVRNWLAGGNRRAFWRHPSRRAPMFDKQTHIF
jgi:hypothetical protein